MNDRLSPKIRALAAISHAIIGIPTSIFAVYGLSLLIFNRNNYSLEGLLIIDFLFGLPTIFLLPVLAWIQWRLTGRIHPFVDRAGRSVLNYTLNMSLLILCLVFAFISTCGLAVNGYFGQSLGTNFVLISLVTLNCIAIAYALNSVIAGIFAFRGLHFKNRLVYPFLRDV
ncbi:hypothetical protein [Chamaesiphon sp. VAR_69_metabat_338]|uniref:hypothetical protein n=1 Tax=Chamaesiphon sp. VAR_69_metabat_338 TaxID=2964704 RepID=UPI00286DE4FF|nr:hypothetical protein [Chamaesiphon sp. VAR_69_metabat_338]